MTPELRRKAEELFQIAVDLASDKWDSFLDEHCGDDPSLRTEVERLLAPDESDLDEFLRTPAYGEARREAQEAAKLPERIGHYTIVRKVGEGGMGVVYEAKQDSPHRTVALKVIRSTLQSRAVSRRFEYEAEILGRLHHPGIAHIYEAGMATVGEDTPDATRYPFFAMEFIRGKTLIQHADAEKFGARERMELVAAICDAIHHAHQNGIIHRDLKPANILVDRDGQPKVLDFGVARLTDDELQSRTLRTGVGQLVGTLPYMSPEQVAADTRLVDARSDVYAIGVLLYELLAGRLPHSFRACSIPEAARVIREEEPLRLSSINTLFRGDIETIVSRTLEKEPERRYPSAAELANDIRRFLRDEPIVARPASTLYQFRKFAKRNKVLVGGVMATMLMFVAGAIVATVLALRESDARRVAEKETTYAQRLAYRTSIAAAAAALREHDCVGARRHLGEAPERLRGWEWRHLFSRLDDSIAETDVGGELLIPPAFRAGDQQLLAVIYPIETDAPTVEAPVVSFRLLAMDAANAVHLTQRSLTVMHTPILSPDGTHVGYVAPGGTFFTEDAVTGDHRAAVGQWPSPQRLGPLAFLPGGRMLLTRADGTLAWLDPSTGETHELSGGEPRYGTAFAVSPDGSMVSYMIGGLGHTEIHVRDVNSGELLHTFRGHSESVLSLAFNPDGTRLASGSADRTIRLWDLTQSGTSAIDVLDEHADRVGAVAFSPDGKVLASGSQDRTVRLWDAATAQPLATYVGHEDEIVRLSFSHEGSLLASGSLNGSVRIWDASPLGDPRILRGHTLYVYPVALSPDERLIASGGWDGTVRLWDAASSTPLAVIPNPQHERSVVTWLTFSPDGRSIVATENTVQAPKDYWVRVIDVDTRECRIVARGPYGWTRIAFHPSGQTIAVAGDAATGVSIWDAASFAELHRVPGSGVCAYNPLGSLLATSEGSDVALYDTTTFKPVSRLGGNEQAVAAVAFDVAGARIASAGYDRTVRVWDVESGRSLAVLHGHSDRVYSVAFSPDGTRLASGANDQTIRLWDTTTWEQVAELRGHRDHVFSLVFSSDGSQLISGSGDCTVRIWETKPLRDRLAARHQRAASTK